MIYLILAILSSSAISLLMRFSNRYVKNNMVMFAANYIVCSLVSLIFLTLDSGRNILPLGSVTKGELTFAVFLGIISGLFYPLSFKLLQFNIQKNGMVLSATFMKLGVLVPIVMSVLLRWDDPTLLQILGCILAVAAIIIVNGEGSKEEGAARAGMWLAALLLVGGLTDSLSNIYDKLGAVLLKDQYLLFSFISAALVCIVLFFVNRQGFSWKDALWGAVIGIPNCFSIRFLLYALADVSAIVVYPVYNITGILLISLLGFTLFKEKLSRRKLLGMGIIIAAILVLNL